MGLCVLPEYKGYTFDFRLKEIRKHVRGGRYEFIDFNSAKGDQLLDEFFASAEGQKEFHRYFKECERDGSLGDVFKL